MSRLVEMNRQQLTAIGEQIEVLEIAVAEHSESISTLNSLFTNDGETGVMIPLGGGAKISVGAPVGDGVLLDIGSGIQAEREYQDAIEILEQRRQSIEEVLQTLRAEFSSTEEKIKQLALQFTQGVENLEKNPSTPLVSGGDETPTDSDEEDKSTITSRNRRRRNLSGEMTLDD